MDNKAPPPVVDKALVSAIEDAFARYSTLTVEEIEDSIRPTVNRVIDGLETGAFRVAEPDNHGGWKVNEWLKKAVLLYFRVHDTTIADAQPAPSGTKLNHASSGYDAVKFRAAGVRVVPGAIARRGSYFGKDVVLMPSFTNIGAMWVKAP